ncbi:MAG: phosphotransferase [Lentimicrobiaceae bacterium]|jgi:aminoglycoside/choline kinase family phosphotransferase|nr:phosphotransferase [Lentimicrobiaceae bacterium]
MSDTNLIHKKLSKLFFDVFGNYPTGIESLVAHGSLRTYFRVFGKETSVIGTYNINIEENEAFFAFAKHFGKLGLPVPEILAVSEKKTCYLQTDLGDTTLFHLVQESLKKDTFDEAVIDRYKECLLRLVEFQVIGNRKLDYSIAYPTPNFGKKAIFDDLTYFKYFFLKLHPEISYNESKLYEDFEKLTDFLCEAPANFFMYRDFQSRNIMIHNDKCYFIDFQSGRQGPLQYDLISILYQVKAQMPQVVRDELYHYYLKCLSKHLDVSELKFETYFSAFVFLRLMQVLGAYGFRGIVQRKTHFLTSIPYAIQEIDRQLTLLNIPLSLPELKGIFQQLSFLKTKYTLPNDKETAKFQIEINSFSYFKTGIPEDKSGHGGGFVFDCRALPNPGKYPEYRLLTGLDKKVIQFLEKEKSVHEFSINTQKLIAQSVENYLERGFKHLMVNFGCTGGQHRSVYFAEKTTAWIKATYPDIEVVCKHLVINSDEQKHCTT